MFNVEKSFDTLNLTNDDLEALYRTAYWNRNELQIIEMPACLAEAAILENVMERVEKKLGYMPAA